MASQKSSRNQQQLVSTMIRQGFISGPLLSPSPSVRPAPVPMSPTLFELMAIEKAREHEPKSDAHKKTQEGVSEELARASFRNHEQWGMGDVRLTVTEAGEGESAAFRVSIDVHRRVLAGKSRFFAEKFRRIGAHSVEILECDDVEVYVEAVVLMYSDDLKIKLMGMAVSKVLSLLKVGSAIPFSLVRFIIIDFITFPLILFGYDDDDIMFIQSTLICYFLGIVLFFFSPFVHLVCFFLGRSIVNK